MVDAHCHLNDEHYSPEQIPLLVSAASESGVTTLICNGAGLESSKKALHIADTYPGVWATVGIHPEEYAEVEKWGEESLKKQLLDMCNHPKVVAIGEAGLDFREDTSPEEKQKQMQLFKINKWLCAQTGLPLVVHNRNADLEIRELLEDHHTGGQMHCFLGNTEWMYYWVQQGFFISYGGIVTFKKSAELRETLARTPLERLLLETDSPFLAPEPVRGSINTPVNVKIVAQTAAEACQVTFDRVETATTHNVLTLFTRIHEA